MPTPDQRAQLMREFRIEVNPTVPAQGAPRANIANSTVLSITCARCSYSSRQWIIRDKFQANGTVAMTYGRSINTTFDRVEPRLTERSKIICPDCGHEYSYFQARELIDAARRILDESAENLTSAPVTEGPETGSAFREDTGHLPQLTTSDHHNSVSALSEMSLIECPDCHERWPTETEDRSIECTCGRQLPNPHHEPPPRNEN